MIAVSDTDVNMTVSESSLPKDLFLLQDPAKLQIRQRRQQSKKEKTVRFFSSVMVRLTITTSEYTSEEKSACWFSANEYEMIRSKCHALVAFSSQSDDISTRRPCTRGLEAHFGNNMMERFARRELVACAVLDMQDSNPFCSEEEIASVCLAVSENSAIEAAARGKSDWKEAQRCLLLKWKSVHWLERQRWLLWSIYFSPSLFILASLRCFYMVRLHHNQHNHNAWAWFSSVVALTFRSPLRVRTSDLSRCFSPNRVAWVLRRYSPTK